MAPESSKGCVTAASVGVNCTPDNAIRIRIMQCGWRQRRLARAVGISDSYLCHMIRGQERAPGMQRAIARKLGVSPEWLWGAFCHPELCKSRTKEAAR